MAVFGALLTSYRSLGSLQAALIKGWEREGASLSVGDYSFGDESNLEQECDLRRGTCVLAAEEARRRMARRQAHREMHMEAAHVVAERGEQRVDGGECCRRWC